MHLVLTGATGLVGSGVLHHILSLSPTTAAAKKITRLSIISRRTDIPLLTHPDRPTNNTHTQIEIIPHTDFKSYPDELLAKLKPIESDNDGKVGVIWALGISQTEVKTDAEYIEITKEYTLAAAKAFQQSLNPDESIQITTNTNPLTSNSTPDPQPTTTSTAQQQNPSSRSTNPTAQVNFIYVSGEGAQQTPGRFTPLFGRIKGETETALLSLSNEDSLTSNFKVYNVRPAGVDGHNQLAVHRLAETRDAAKNIGYRAMKVTLLPVLRAGVWSSMHSPTEELGKVFVELACGDGGALNGVGTEGWQGRIVRNAGLRRFFKEMSARES